MDYLQALKEEYILYSNEKLIRILKDDYEEYEEDAISIIKQILNERNISDKLTINDSLPDQVSELQYAMLDSMEYSSIKYCIMNFILVLISLALEKIAHGGGTGDVEDGYSLITIYLIISCVSFFIYSIRSFIHANHEKKSLKKISARFIFIFSLLILCFLIFRKVSFTQTTVLGFLQSLNATLYFLIAEVLAFLMFSIVISTICYKSKIKSAGIILRVNICVLSLYIVLIITGVVGKIFM